MNTTTLKSLAFSFIAGIIAILLWRAELGTDSHPLQWLQESQRSPLVITALVIMAYLFPFWIKEKTKNINIFIAFISLYIISIIAFAMTIGGFSMLYSPWGGPSGLLFLVFVLLVHSLLFFVITNYILQKVPFKQFLLNLLTIVGAFGIGWGVLEVWQETHPFAYDALISSVRYGYCYFLIVFFMGINGLISSDLKKKEELVVDNILDSELV